MARTTGEADANGTTLYYETAGEGTPLVLCPAALAATRIWEAKYAGWERQNIPNSPMVPGPYSHHEDLRALLDHLGVQRAALIGCSMGGATVVDFALENPERVDTLVLVGSAVGGFEFDEEPPKEWDEIVAAEEAGDLEHVSELEVRMWVDGPNRPPDAVDPAIRDRVRKMNLIALKNEALDLGEEQEPEVPATVRLPEIQAPTLILIGDQDRPAPWPPPTSWKKISPTPKRP